LKNGIVSVKQEIQTIKDRIASVDSELADYQEKYDSLDFDTNYDIALAVNNLDGAELQSIKSLAIKDGETFECSEVSTPDDVEFFSEETKKMSFQLKLTDLSKFVASLKESALVTDSMIIDCGDKSATLVIATVFSTPDDVSTESTDTSSDSTDVDDDSEGPSTNSYE
jgi:hypothetical protein